MLDVNVCEVHLHNTDLAYNPTKSTKTVLKHESFLFRITTEARRVLMMSLSNPVLAYHDRICHCLINGIIIIMVCGKLLLFMCLKSVMSYWIHAMCSPNTKHAQQKFYNPLIETTVLLYHLYVDLTTYA